MARRASGRTNLQDDILTVRNPTKHRPPTENGWLPTKPAGRSDTVLREVVMGFTAKKKLQNELSAGIYSYLNIRNRRHVL